MGEDQAVDGGGIRCLSGGLRLAEARSRRPDLSLNYVALFRFLPLIWFHSAITNLMPYVVYILLCADGSYYTGSANDFNRRLQEHQEGVSPTAYTFRRRPVKLVWSEEVETLDQALYHEHQIKGWSRAKKEALIRGDFQALHEIVRAERKQREKEKRGLSN